MEERNKYNELITGGRRVNYAGVPRAVGRGYCKNEGEVWGWESARKGYVRESERGTITLRPTALLGQGAGDRSLKPKTNKMTKGVTILSARKPVFPCR